MSIFVTVLNSTYFRHVGNLSVYVTKISDDYTRYELNLYSTGDQYCGGRLDKPSGTFKTPNWPEKDYPAGVTCSWHIVAPKNQVRMFKIN